jgi:hypothetical protein
MLPKQVRDKQKMEQAGKNTNKNKRQNNKVTNEINVQDDDGEIIELQNGERQLDKEERIVSSFNF